MIKLAFQLAVMIWPKRWRYRLLRLVLGYQIDPSASVGFSLFRCDQLAVGAGCRIGHLNYVGSISRLELEEGSTIGNLNWFGGLGEGHAVHFRGEAGRRAVMWLGRQAGVTNRHHFDCTGGIEIGPFALVAGHGTEILTHSIDLSLGRQVSAPVVIGAYTFLGTRVIVLKGVSLADRVAVGAGAVCTSNLMEELTLYAGSPARAIKRLPPNAAFFCRTEGFVA